MNRGVNVRYDFFKTTEDSNIVKSGGPSKTEQLRAIYEGKYWTVLDPKKLLKKCKERFQNDKDLLYEANAIKAAIQTYGPKSNLIPEMKKNTNPKTKGNIFHAHAKDKCGTEYIVEWEIIEEEKKIVELVGFDTHENYSFKGKKYSDKDKEIILNKDRNIEFFRKVSEKLLEARKKVIDTNKMHGLKI